MTNSEARLLRRLVETVEKLTRAVEVIARAAEAPAPPAAPPPVEPGRCAMHPDRAAINYTAEGIGLCPVCDLVHHAPRAAPPFDRVCEHQVEAIDRACSPPVEPPPPPPAEVAPIGSVGWAYAPGRAFRRLPVGWAYAPGRAFRHVSGVLLSWSARFQVWQVTTPVGKYRAVVEEVPPPLNNNPIAPPFDRALRIAVRRRSGADSADLDAP